MPSVSMPAPGAAAAPPANAPQGFAIPAGAPPPRLGGSDPDKMVNTGFANHFNGRIESIWALPRKQQKGKKANTYTGFMELNIRADDTSLGQSGLVTEYYGAFSLNQWVPSRSVEWDAARNMWVYTPAGGDLDAYMQLHTGAAGFPVPDKPGETAVLPPHDWRGWFVIPGKQNSQEDLGRGTKWHHFTTELKKTKYHELAPHINHHDYRQFLIGVYANFVRMPFVFQGGTPPDSGGAESETKIETLCVNQILDLGPMSSPRTVQVAVPGTFQAQVAPTPSPAPVPAPGIAQPAPVPGPAPAAPGSLSSDPAAIEAATNEILTRLAVERGAAGISRADAGTVVFNELNQGGLQGALGLMKCNDKTWLAGDDRTFYFIPAKDQIAATQEIAVALASAP